MYYLHDHQLLRVVVGYELLDCSFHLDNTCFLPILILLHLRHIRIDQEESVFHRIISDQKEKAKDSGCVSNLGPQF